MSRGVSIIICCYNSARRLPETIVHIVHQKNINFDWELIIVDNASTDTTSSIAKELLSASLPAEKFKIVFESAPGLINARKKGVSVARFGYLVFCDDDNWLSEDYVSRAFETMESNPKIGMLGGCGEPVFENVKPAWFDAYQINFAVGDQAPDSKADLTETDMVYGAGCVARKIVFQQLEKLNFASLLSGRKGNSLISGDDNELCLMIRYMGYEIWYNRKLTFKHLMTSGRMNWSYLKRLHYGFGRTRLYLQAYKYLEHNDTPPGKDLKYPLWLDKYINKAIELKKYVPHILFKLSEEGNDEVLKFMAQRGEMYELRQLKNNYKTVFEKIIELKKRVKAAA